MNKKYFIALTTLLILGSMLFICYNKRAKIEPTKTNAPGLFVEVIDGDSFKAFYKGKFETIRLSDIDCFETAKGERLTSQAKRQNISENQALQKGKEAKQNLLKLLMNHSLLFILEKGRDRYQRLWAHVYTDNINVNQYMFYEANCNAFLNGADYQPQSKRQPVVVSKVVDGDTVEAILINKKKNIKIRLAGIDCPEKRKSKRLLKQQKIWKMSEDELKKSGHRAKEKLKEIIAENTKNIYFEETPQKVCDGEQRSVGILWTEDGININDYMIQNAGCLPYSCADKWM